MREAADWVAALLTLPDSSFFELMRTYLGDIKTPFNKQRLIADLQAFLARKEVREGLYEYLSDEDLRILAATELLEEPTVAELSTFFDRELSYAELHAILLNLEERLFIYRFQDERGRRVAGNPLIAELASSKAGGPEILFPSKRADGSNPGETNSVWRSGAGSAFSDGGIAALISTLRRGVGTLKTDGTPKKRMVEDLQAIFSDGSAMAAVRSLRAMGIAYSAENILVLDEGRLESLAALDPRDRAFYLAAAVALSSEDEKPEADERGAQGVSTNEEGQIPHHHFVRPRRERVAAVARLLLNIVETLPNDRLFPETSLVRYIVTAALLETAHSRGHRSSRYGSSSGELPQEGFSANAVGALMATGLLLSDGEGYFRISELGAPRHGQQSTVAAHAHGPSLVVDASFSVLVYPELPFEEALNLTRFLDAAQAGNVFRYELTRTSAIRGFDSLVSPDTIADTLESLSGHPLPQNVRFSLEDWYRRYSAAALHRGLVLVLDDERRFLAERGPLEPLVSRVLAPGVFLLATDDDAAVSRALAQAGVDVIGRPGKAGKGEPGDEGGKGFVHFHPLLPRRRKPPAFEGPRDPGSVPREKQEEAAPSIESERKKTLLAALDARRLSKDQREELNARIERKIILLPSQLAQAAIRYEKLEAKGLDYVGKVRVAELALSTGSLLEAYWRGPKGQAERALGLPMALDKSEGEIVIALKVANPRRSSPTADGETPQDMVLRIPVGKISLLRRIKRSIFGE